MPKVPPEILELARSHHRQLLSLEKDARARVREELDRAVRRIETDRTFRSFSDFRSLQLSQVEILARISREKTSEGLESALEGILEAGLLLAPNHAESELNRWIEFYGGEARPMNLAALAAASRDTLIERIPTSLATWGPDVARRVRRELSASITTAASREEVLNGIQGAIGAERWKADRIFRTELFDSYNEAHLESLELARDVYSIDAKKSAIVTFDGRTDEDSLPMHGQVRELDENFVDGDGRRFLHPPGRPNDREKEIPWLEDAPPEIVSLEEGQARIDADLARRQEIANRGRTRRGLPPLGAPRVPRAPLTYEERREALILSWTQGSNSNDAIRTKAGALEEFGLEGQIWNPRGRVVPTELSQRKADLRRMYDESQAFYQGERVGSVRLYRGVKTDTIVEGTVEGWTSNPELARRFAGPNGHVLVADVDTRRVLASVDTPGWANGRFGDQGEYLVLSDVPELRFDLGDWQSGPFRAGDLDPDALSAGPWGVLQDSRGRARLEHLPSGRTLLEGVEYSRDELVEAARYLDRSDFFDGLGRITPAGVDELGDAIDVLRVRYGANVPAGANAARAIELEGNRWGVINADIKPGTPGKWSRRTVKVVREGTDGFYFEELSGTIQGNFAVVTDAAGPGDGYFTLVHLPTGKPLLEGGRTFYSAGFRVPVDIGGYGQKHVQAIAEALEELFDEGGALLANRVDDFERLAEHMRSIDFANVASGDTPEDHVARLWRVLDDDADDDLDDFFDVFFPKTTATSGPRAGAAREARASMRGAPEAPTLTPGERFEKDVEGRRDTLRRGGYNRFDDNEYDKAVQAEARRRDDEATKKRLEASAKRAEIGFSVGDGRDNDAAFAERTARLKAAAAKEQAEKAERALLEAEEERELRERETLAKELALEQAAERARIKADDERRAKRAREAEEAAEKARKEEEKARKAEEKARKEAEKERLAQEKAEEEAKEKARIAEEELEKKKARDDARAELARKKEELEARNYGTQHDPDSTVDEVKAAEERARLAGQAALEDRIRKREARRNIPNFAKPAEAEEWGRANLAKHVKLKRSYDLDGVQEAFAAVEDMNDRFDLGTLFAITDQAHFNANLSREAGFRLRGGGAQGVTAAYGDNVLVIKKQAFDSLGVGEAMDRSNAYYREVTNPTELVQKMRDRSHDDAADRLEKLVAQGWQDRHVISDTTEKVIRHELGHKFHNDRTKASSAIFQSMIDRLHRQGWGTPIGRYASSSASEYAAESMVAYTSGDWHLLPDELVAFYQGQDRKASATRELATKRLALWESQSEDRLAKKAQLAKRVAAAEAELAKAEAARKALGESLTPAELEILEQDPKEVERELLGNDPENRLQQMMWIAWQARRRVAEQKKARLGK